MNVENVSGVAQPHVMSGASVGMPPQQNMTSLFDKIDSAGAGTINQAQFSAAFQVLNPPAAFKGQGADKIWSQLDPNGSGTVSKKDFVDTMKGLMASLRAQPGATLAASTDALNRSL